MLAIEREINIEIKRFIWLLALEIQFNLSSCCRRLCQMWADGLTQRNRFDVVMLIEHKFSIQCRLEVSHLEIEHLCGPIDAWQPTIIARMTVMPSEGIFHTIVHLWYHYNCAPSSVADFMYSYACYCAFTRVLMHSNGSVNASQQSNVKKTCK